MTLMALGVPSIATALVDLDDGVEAQKAACRNLGGTAETHYEFNTAGGVESATVDCSGGLLDGWRCGLIEMGSLYDSACAYPDMLGDEGAEVEAVAVGPTGGVENTGASESGDPADVAVQPGSVADASQGEELTIEIGASPEEQVAACEIFGGTGTVTNNAGTATVDVHCRGGLLDGMSCMIGHYDSYCTYYRVTTDPAALDGVTPDTLPEVLDDPTGDGSTVILNQSGTPVDTAASQAAICRIFGGTPLNTMVLDGNGAVGTSLSYCDGGLLDGMLCANSIDDSSCAFFGTIPESPAADSPAGNEVPANDAPAAPPPTVVPTAVVDTSAKPTPTPTMMPTTEPTVAPTVVPTEVPVEPTIVPTLAPPPPQNDNSLPPGGGVEDPVLEPTPTEVVLF
jgi:hypothetical protein